MILKWIVCTVQEKKKEKFSDAQEKWSVLEHAKGFQWQIGGWSAAGEACILACWENQKSYDIFMETIHDRIYLQTNQGKTYDDISVALYDAITLPNNIISLFQTEKGLYVKESSFPPTTLSYLLLGHHNSQYLIVSDKEISDGRKIVLKPNWCVYKKITGSLFHSSDS